MKSNITFRISYGLLLLVSVLFTPYPVSFALAFMGMLYFRNYFEAPFLLLVSDVIYGVAEERFNDMVAILFITSFIMVIAVEYLKKELKFYSK